MSGLSPLDVTKMWLGSHISLAYQCNAEYQHFNFSLMVLSSSSIQFQVSLNKKKLSISNKTEKGEKECPQTIRPFLYPSHSLYRPIRVWFLLLYWRSKRIIIMTQLLEPRAINTVYRPNYIELYCGLFIVNCTQRDEISSRTLSSF